MSIKYPYDPENEHPQYLWNEHEFIIRALTQNKIGVGVSESGTNAILYLTENNSFNNVARGMVQFPIGNFTANISTTSRGWVYIKADGTGFSTVLTTEPIYNQWHHGWYDSYGNRAVAFIDNEAEIGYRVIIMDSFNYSYEYDHRIPDTGGTPINLSTYLKNTWNTISLPAGRYRFELKGGTGGKGGRSSSVEDYPGLGIPADGGLGAEGQIAIKKLVLLQETKIDFFIGGNGADGSNGAKGNGWNASAYDKSEYVSVAVGGGGGASGGDAAIRINKNQIIVAKARGGSGGGGGASGRKRGDDSIPNFAMTGGGGGGEGYGDGENGKQGENTCYFTIAMFYRRGLGGGRGGTFQGLYGGGACNYNGDRGYYEVHADPVKDGEDYFASGASPFINCSFSGESINDADNSFKMFRNGGASAKVTGDRGIAGAPGGTSLLNSSNGYVNIIRIGDVLGNVV